MAVGVLLGAAAASAGPVNFFSDSHPAVSDCHERAPVIMDGADWCWPVTTSSFQPVVGRFGLLPPRPLICSCLLHNDHEPKPGNCGCLAQTYPGDFSPTQTYPCQPYSPCDELGVYGDKFMVPVQRPIVELGFPFYNNGPVPPSETWCGETNLVQPKFYVYGDYRVAYAVNKNINQSEFDVLAHRLNLELDYWITSTERVHAFVGPFQEDGAFMRLQDGVFFDELQAFNPDTDTLWFEGDLGQMLGGWTNRLAPFDLPVTAGLIPLLFQNGVWTLDQMVGVAAAIPAQNSPRFDLSNYDVTFFAAFDQVSTAALDQAAHSGHIYGVHTFIEARGGYLELGYGFVEDRAGLNRSYHNIGLSYTRRYLNRVSNSVRVIVNTGQDLNDADETADGVLLLLENSLLTRNPYHFVPYINAWVGFDRPQPLARAGGAGGVLFNTGILFQSDALTGYPTLDATGADTTGVAIGVDLIGDACLNVSRFPYTGFDQQLIIEAAALHAFGDPTNRTAAGDQYGVGIRYQLPLSEAHLIRADGLWGQAEGVPNQDIYGGRIEFRWKF